MKLKEYAAALNVLLADNPDAAEYQVVFARDDEGNGFSRVAYEPQLGRFDAEEKDFDEEGDPNSVCLN